MKRYSEKELIKLSGEQVRLLNNYSSDNGIKDSFSDSLPCWMHLNSLTDLGLNYMNKKGLEDFNKSMDDISGEGSLNFLIRIVHPETTKTVIPMLSNFIGDKNPDRIQFFEQRMKHIDCGPYKNHLSFSMVNNVLNSLFTVTFPSGILEDFIKKRIFPDSDLFNKFYSGFSLLTKREKEILKYMALGISNNQVSNLLSISALTIKTHRRNIMTKLQTNNITELTRIALYFNLLDEL